MSVRALFCERCGHKLPDNSVEVQLEGIGALGNALAICSEMGALREVVLKKRGDGKRPRLPSSRDTYVRNLIWLMLKKRGLSFPQIAQMWGVDHTSVVGGVQQAEMSPIGKPLSYREIEKIRREQRLSR